MSDIALPEMSAPAKPTRKPFIVGLLLGALLPTLGVAIAWFYAGPKLVEYRAESILNSAIAQAVGCGLESMADHSGVETYAFQMQGIVAHPKSATGRTRTLILSLALQVGSEEDVQALEGKELMLRDALLRRLDAADSGEVASANGRDVVEAIVLGTAAEVLPGMEVLRVLFTQFYLD